jgi:hypothetical protein
MHETQNLPPNGPQLSLSSQTNCMLLHSGEGGTSDCVREGELRSYMTDEEKAGVSHLLGTRPVSRISMDSIRNFPLRAR